MLSLTVLLPQRKGKVYSARGVTRQVCLVPVNCIWSLSPSVFSAFRPHAQKLSNEPSAFPALDPEVEPCKSGDMPLRRAKVSITVHAR